MAEAANNEPVDPVLAMRLDAFTVPELPSGFADRLVAAALAEAPSGASGLPPLRRPPARRWLRGGVAGLGALAVGMISISAAAMGYLGEPIRHAVRAAPVIGNVIERVIPKATRQPKRTPPARLARPAAPKIEAAASAVPLVEAQPARRLTPMERRARVREIMSDPEKRRAWMEAHPKAARRIIRREQMRQQRIETGLMPQQMPLRAMPGPMRRERLERLRERRRERLELRGMMVPPAGEAQP